MAEETKAPAAETTTSEARPAERSDRGPRGPRPGGPGGREGGRKYFRRKKVSAVAPVTPEAGGSEPAPATA